MVRVERGRMEGRLGSKYYTDLRGRGKGVVLKYLKVEGEQQQVIGSSFP